MFCDQQIDCILRNGDFSDRVFRFGTRDVRFACAVASGLLADENRLIFDVQVCPLERHQFSFAQSADEFQIEHGQDATLICCRQVGFDLFRRQDPHFVLWDFGRNAVIRWIAHNQAFLDCPVERVVQHCVNAADRGITQPRLLSLLRFAEPPVFL